MYPNEQRALCVAIHDVAPATWPECQHLLQAIRAVADIPLSWLVVPHFHGRRQPSPGYEAALGALLAQGHELVLHGYTHLDAAPLGRHGPARWLRTLYTQREGEFSALAAAEARRRIDLGRAWFAERGWPVDGFVAPAWLVGRHAWEAIAEQPFLYTTTFSSLHVLRPPRVLLAPALVYAARNRTGRLLSPPAASLLAGVLRRTPLIRLALHPRDAHHPRLVRHAQSLIERLLLDRAGMTKAAFARRLAGQDALTSTVPNARRTPSADDRNQRSS